MSQSTRSFLVLSTLLLCVAPACSGSPEDVSATSSGAAALSHADAVARAEEWVNVQLPYCQSANHQRDYDPACSPICTRPDNAAWDPYRSDCSGLVSWAWGLPAPGRVTREFAPFVNDITSAIPASSLQPGDAVNNNEHVMLFKSWVVQNQVATFIEEPGCATATPYAHEFSSGVSVNGSSIYVAYNTMTFTAIRFNGISDGPPPPPTYYYQGMARDASGAGYWIVGRDGGVFSFGDAGFHGSTGGARLNSPVVAMQSTPDGQGYWLVASDGGIFSFGDAPFYGSAGGSRLNAPVVGMAAMPNASGYWLVASDGGVFAYGRAPFRGSMGGTHLNAPVVGIAATADGGGYWLVASDGGIFAFGDAGFHGSMGGAKLNAPVVGMAATPGGGGYWLVAADGGIFAFGDAPFHGSAGNLHLNAPIVGMAATPSGAGYWLIAGDGGIFAFGDARFAGSRG